MAFSIAFRLRRGRRPARPWTYAASLLLLAASACTPYLHQHALLTQPARLGAEINGNDQWRQLPAPREKAVVAVYKFRDQTGQYKPQANGSSFSTAVTQGATSVLMRALEESQWFESIERENIGNLLNERKIIRSTRAEYSEQTGRKQPNLPPMLFASIILEGGIISYDANIISGGGGLRYFGAGASGQYRQDRVTVYLRAISTNSGRILKTVYTSKTILSQQVDASLFRFVKFKRLLETETGFTYNEPSDMAVKDAIEKSVQALIYEGILEKIWTPQDTSEVHGPALKAYLHEKNDNLSIDEMGREMKPRRAPMGVGLTVASQRYSGDFSTPLSRLGTELNLRYQVNEPWSAFLNVGRGGLAAGSGSAFDKTYAYAEAGVLFRLMPRDRMTPFFLAGGGATSPEPLEYQEPYGVLGHVVLGAGVEFMLTNHWGINLTIDNHYFFNDQLDRLARGRYNDYYWSGRLGAILYLGRPHGPKFKPLH
jgi:curli production assembly/transport component CsgG